MSQVQTIDRLLLILDCFTEQEAQLSMTEISRRLGLTTSTAHRLLSSLEFHGLLSRAADGRSYMLGFRFLHWASIVEKSNVLQLQARPILDAISKETGETAVLMVRDGSWAVCLDRVDSPQSLRIAMSVGQRIPLHAGSSAKILLAHCQPQEIDTIIEEHGLPIVGVNTITDPQKLQADLAQICSDGYAYSIQERDPDAAGLTVAVANGNHEIIAGLGIVGPMTRLTPDVVEGQLAIVTDYAMKLSNMLQHYKGDPQRKISIGDLDNKIVISPTP